MAILSVTTAGFYLSCSALLSYTGFWFADSLSLWLALPALQNPLAWLTWISTLALPGLRLAGLLFLSLPRAFLGMFLAFFLNA